MTIIGAKKINNNWNIFSDDCVSIGEYTISAAKNYRRKIREIPRAPRQMFVATAGSCRQVDVVLNYIDRVISKSKKNITTLQLKDLLQQIMIETYKELKQVDDENPNTIILLLDVETDTCFMIEAYAVNILDDNVEYVGGSGDDTFYKLNKLPSQLDNEEKFIKNFVYAADDAPGCGLPVYQVNKYEAKTLDLDGVIAKVEL